MKEPAVVHNTFTIERSYSATPERVFAAFSDPAKKRLWYADGGHKVENFEMDFRPGGTEKTRYLMGTDTPFPGTPLTNDALFEDIVPNSRIVMSSTMAIGGKRISASLVTFEILPTDKGTDLIFTHQGAFFENSGGPEMRQEGWRKIIDRLAEQI